MTDRSGSGMIRALVFDMGGVLVELGEPATVFGLDTGAERFLEHWLMSDTVRDFERDAIDIDTFARSIVTEAALPYDAAEFVRRFMAWPRSAFPGATRMLDSIPGEITRVLLSNTNRYHWHEAGLADALSPHLDRIFLSFETGHLKPDESAFTHVCESIGCAPDQVVFFDDNPLNVRAARAIGIRAIRTRGIDELRNAIAGLDFG